MKRIQWSAALRTTAISVALLSLVAACGASSGESKGSASSKKLVAIVAGGTYGDALKETQLKQFEKDTGISVEFIEGGSNQTAQIKAQVESGSVQWDLVGCTPEEIIANPGLWEPIDYSVVTSTDDLVDDDSAKKHYVLHDFESTPLLAYNTEKQSRAPKSWADFFDVKGFPGKRGVPNLGIKSAWGLPLVALLADGVDQDELLPLDLDRAYDKLKTLKPSISAYYAEYSQGQDLLQSGDVSMAILTDGRALQLKNAGAPVDVVWNQGVVSHACIASPKGAPNAKNAMKFIEWYLANPEAQVEFTKATTYGPPTERGVEAAKEAGIKDFTSLHVDQLVPQSDELLNYINENSEELLKRWNKFSQG